jgi:Flp pilus assembly protein TadG
MRPSSKSRNRQRGATIVLLMAMIPLLLIPLVGLAVDGTRLYIVNSKLSSAVDGAVLGAGRLLGTNANTTEIAGEFLRANFPNGYWSTDTLNPSINFTNNLGVQTISIYATVNLPNTFARLMGHPSSVVSASAIATRRVTRIEMVLDRSGSMNHNDPVTGQNVFTIMKQGAQWFAAQFTPGYDELGLVVFNGGAIVAYPTTRPWDPSPTGAGGPDKTFATNVQTQTGPIFTSLTNMAVGGGTGTPEALQMAYIELQKAHNRDLAANGSDNTLNTIVLFTDGVPDSIATYVNNPANNSLKPTSSCTYNPATATASTQMRGYIVAPQDPPGPSNPFPGWGANQGWNSLGLIRLGGYDNSQTLTWWLQNPNDMTYGNPTSSLAGCQYLNGSSDSGNNIYDLQDLAHVPTADMYGNSTTGAYAQSVLFDGTNTWSPNTGSYSPSTPTRGYDVAAAAWNATDNIGNTIRSQNAMNQIQIFTIGYSGNGGTDLALLKRLANTPQSTSFVLSQPIGKFYLVNNTNQLMSAFDSVASSLLRLAQ